MKMLSEYIADCQKQLAANGDHPVGAMNDDGELPAPVVAFFPTLDIIGDPKTDDYEGPGYEISGEI